jgi:hypothetical protein
MTRQICKALTVLLLCSQLVAEEPTNTEPEQPAEVWKEGIVEEFPTMYDSYIPGFKAGESTSLEIEAGPVEVEQQEPERTGDPDSGFDLAAWFENRNVISILTLIGISILFVIYQMRSGSRRRG